MKELRAFVEKLLVHGPKAKTCAPAVCAGAEAGASVPAWAVERPLT